MNRGTDAGNVANRRADTNLERLGARLPSLTMNGTSGPWRCAAMHGARTAPRDLHRAHRANTISTEVAISMRRSAESVKTPASNVRFTLLGSTPGSSTKNSKRSPNSWISTAGTQVAEPGSTGPVSRECSCRLPPLKPSERSIGDLRSSPRSSTVPGRGAAGRSSTDCAVHKAKMDWTNPLQCRRRG